MLGTDATFSNISLEGGWEPRQVLSPIIPGALALALLGSAGVWALHTRLTVAPGIIPDIVVDRVIPARTPAPAAAVASNPYGEIIIDPSFLAEMTPPSPAENLSPQAILEAVPPPPSASIPPQTVPLPPKRDVPQIVDSAPLPPPRPPELGPLAIPAAPQPNGGTAAAAPADNRNFFQKLFGLGQPSGPAIANLGPESRGAHAAPEGRSTNAAPPFGAASAPVSRAGRAPFAAFPPTFGASAPFAGYDRYTAVYDISARTVYLPDGTRLEAHSGLGDRLDDPRFVSERMRGATPPNIYELEPREASFHGVQALRLNPIGDSALYGRAGLLAHPYMLGPNGDSNGCVSFKDYNAFLRAYQNGQIKRLAVVARWS